MSKVVGGVTVQTMNMNTSDKNTIILSTMKSIIYRRRLIMSNGWKWKSGEMVHSNSKLEMRDLYANPILLFVNVVVAVFGGGERAVWEDRLLIVFACKIKNSASYVWAN
jgi:hypothetical protein